jgi:hypothetical protein
MKATKISVRIDSVPAMIETKHLIKALSWNLSGGTEENYEKPQSE